jgi:hypothetical protein
MAAISCSTISFVRSIDTGEMSMSPKSAIRRPSNGDTRRTGFQGRIMADCTRISRGPNRAPARYDVPPS